MVALQSRMEELKDEVRHAPNLSDLNPTRGGSFLTEKRHSGPSHALAPRLPGAAPCGFPVPWLWWWSSAPISKLQAERLKEAILDCQTANILVDISSAGCRHALQQVELVDLNLSDDVAVAFTMTGGKKLRIKLPLTNNGGDPLQPSTPPNKVPTINWKGGYALDADGQRRLMTAKELDELRRERNRMHAKMTRDRKKLLMASLEQTVNDLESKNTERRRALSQTLTSSVSPHLVTHLASALNIADVVDSPSPRGRYSR